MNGSSPSERRTGTYARAFSFAFTGFGANALIALVSTIALARLYGAEVLGEFALAYAPTGALWYISTVGEQPALIRRLAGLAPRDPDVTGLSLPVFAFSTALTVVAAVVLAGLSWLLFNGPIDNPDLLAPALVNLAAYLVVTNPGWNIDSILSAFRAGEDLFAVRLHQAAVNLAAALLIYTVSPDVWGLTAATVLSYATSLVHRLVSVRKWIRFRVPRASLRRGRDELPDLVRFGLKLAPGSASYGASNQAGTWILGSVASAAAVGVYSRAWSLAQRFLELNYRISEVLLPTLVDRRERGDQEGSDRALADTLRIVTLVMALPAAAGGGAAAGVMEVLGPDFEPGADALAILLLLPIATTLAQVQVHLLIAVGEPWVSTGFSFCRLVATAGAAIPLAAAHGITGAALGMLIGALVQFVLQTLYTRRFLVAPLTTWWPLSKILTLFVGFAAAFAAARGVDVLLDGVMGTLAALLVGSAVYVLSLLVFGQLNERDRARLRGIAGRRVAAA